MGNCASTNEIKKESSLAPESKIAVDPAMHFPPPPQRGRCGADLLKLKPIAIEGNPTTPVINNDQNNNNLITANNNFINNNINSNVNNINNNINQNNNPNINGMTNNNLNNNFNLSANPNWKNFY